MQVKFLALVAAVLATSDVAEAYTPRVAAILHAGRLQSEARRLQSTQGLQSKKSAKDCRDAAHRRRSDSIMVVVDVNGHTEQLEIDPKRCGPKSSKKPCKKSTDSSTSSKHSKTSSESSSKKSKKSSESSSKKSKKSSESSSKKPKKSDESSSKKSKKSDESSSKHCKKSHESLKHSHSEEHKPCHKHSHHEEPATPTNDAAGAATGTYPSLQTITTPGAGGCGCAHDGGAPAGSNIGSYYGDGSYVFGGPSTTLPYAAEADPTVTSTSSSSSSASAQPEVKKQSSAAATAAPSIVAVGFATVLAAVLLMA